MASTVKREPSKFRNNQPPGTTLKALIKLPKDPSACWEWLGYKHPTSGYGQKRWHKQLFPAHRWVWMVLFGTIPDTLLLENLCGNKACVSPHHWRLAAKADIARGSVSSLLTAGDVAEIRAVPMASRKTKADRAAMARTFAARFGCSPQAIYDVWARRSWKSSKALPSGASPAPAEAVAVMAEEV